MKHDQNDISFNWLDIIQHVKVGTGNIAWVHGDQNELGRKHEICDYLSMEIRSDPPAIPNALAILLHS